MVGLQSGLGVHETTTKMTARVRIIVRVKKQAGIGLLRVRIVVRVRITSKG